MRCALVARSAMSLIAPTATFPPPRSRMARSDCRPIRPNPLIPIRTMAHLLTSGYPPPGLSRDVTRAFDPPEVHVQQVPPDKTHVVENPDAEGDDRAQVEVQPEEVAQSGQQRGERGVDDEAGEEDGEVEPRLQLRPG